MKLTYFPTRGRAEPIRLMLAAKKITFEDIKINPSDWPKIKPTTPYGKLPTLELSDGTVLSDSIAIARYVARLTGFYPDDSDPTGQAKVDGLVGFVTDFLEVVVKVPFEKDETAKIDLVKKVNGEVLPDLVTRCEKVLKDNGGTYLVGQKMTWADVYLYDSVTAITDPVQSIFFSDLGEERLKALDYAPLLQDLIKRVGEVEGIKKWVENRTQ